MSILRNVNITDPLTSDGRVNISDARLEIALGNVDKYTVTTIFGANPDIDTGTDPEDVWCQGGTYTFSTTADITQISSSDNTDTELITIEGLDADWNATIQQVTLTGQTPATLTTPLIRVNSVSNSGANELIGNVYVSTTGAALTAGIPNVESTIRSLVVPQNQISCSCIFSTPANTKTLVVKGYVAYGKSSSTGADFSFKYRLFGGVFKTATQLSLIGSGSSTWEYSYGTPLVLPPKSDVKLVCETVEANNTSVSGGIDFIIVEI